MAPSKFARVAVATVVVIALGATRASAQSGPCTNAGEVGFDPAGYCPYGYVAKESDPPITLAATVAACCERDGTIVSFPECTATSSAGATGLQAIVADDSSWRVQDGNGFTRSVGKFTGMCFSVKIDKADCDAADTKCCTSKPPAFLQFKVNASPDASCRLSYGGANANPQALKRITAWQSVGTVANTDAAKFFNVPIVWKKGSKTGTACLYTLDTDAPSCMFEKVCGLNDARVPDATGSYDEGCELRVIGRKGPASTACCAPTMSVTSFDSLDENRLAGAPASGKIELQG